MELTHYEAALALLIDRALRIGRLNRKAPTFTTRGMARAIEGLRSVRERPNEYDVAGLLDQMGVFADARRKRSIWNLLKAPPRRPSQARTITEKSDTHSLSLLSAVPPHLITTC